LDAFILTGGTPLGWLKSAFSYFLSDSDTSTLHHWTIKDLEFTLGEKLCPCHLDGDELPVDHQSIEIKTIPRGIKIIL
jgi:hypothetical protein